MGKLRFKIGYLSPKARLLTSVPLALSYTTLKSVLSAFMG